MRFGLLGPSVVTDDAGAAVRVQGARLRVLLAALLLRANAPVSTDALAEAVWDGAPSPGAEQTLHSHIARLRRALGPRGAGRVVARDPGFQLCVQPGELDVLVFEELCGAAGAALQEGAWERAAGAAGEALQLWRGTPLLDVPSQVLLDRFVPRLEQLRLQVFEDHAEAQLNLGRHEPLLPQLRELTAVHPLREHGHAQLMLALYRCGRQAEALAAFQQARRAIVHELGVEPGPRLRDLHQRILAADVDLLGPMTAESATVTAAGGTVTTTATVARPLPVVPRQLPAAIGHFTGRIDELTALSGLLSQMSEGGGAGVISAISGTAGIGKTALAVHWAHQAAQRFPDGQLYVNLRGFDPLA